MSQVLFNKVRKHIKTQKNTIVYPLRTKQEEKLKNTVLGLLLLTCLAITPGLHQLDVFQGRGYCLPRAWVCRVNHF